MTAEKEIPESHKLQIAEGARRSMIKAGVPEALVDTTIGDLQAGPAIASWLASEGAESLAKRGEPWVMEVSTDDHFKVLPVIARAFMLRSVTCKIVRLSSLASMVETRSYEVLANLHFSGILFIQGFFGVSATKEDRPLTSYQRAVIQDLILERMASGRGVVLEVTNRVGRPAKIGDWWMPALTSILTNQLKVTKP